MSVKRKPTPRLPPRWFIRAFWAVHRALCSASGGRLGLRGSADDRWGMLQLRTIGRRTGKERKVILGYLENGPDLVLLAMNGWAEPAPAWWLNLKAHPDATVDLPEGSRQVRARVPDGEERSRLWAKWAGVNEDLDAYAAMRSRETPVIILEPRPER